LQSGKHWGVHWLGSNPVMLPARCSAGWGSPAKLRRTWGPAPALLPEEVLLLQGAKGKPGEGGLRRGRDAPERTPTAVVVVHWEEGQLTGGSTR